jgi:uncharacterized membrane protein
MFGLGWQELLLLLIVGGIVYALFLSTPARRRLTGQLDPSQGRRSLTTAASDADESAEEILARRYAQGDIDRAEFETMRSVIQQNRN